MFFRKKCPYIQAISWMTTSTNFSALGTSGKAKSGELVADDIKIVQHWCHSSKKYHRCQARRQYRGEKQWLNEREFNRLWDIWKDARRQGRLTRAPTSPTPAPGTERTAQSNDANAPCAEPTVLEPPALGEFGNSAANDSESAVAAQFRRADAANQFANVSHCASLTTETGGLSWKLLFSDIITSYLGSLCVCDRSTLDQRRIMRVIAPSIMSSSLKQIYTHKQALVPCVHSCYGYKISKNQHTHFIYCVTTTQFI